VKIALITDTHWGARGDSEVFAEYFNEFYYDFFFPYLQENKIGRIFHLGDIVDRRKYINFVTARHLNKFVNTCWVKDIKLDVIVGNHDTSFKNTNDVNSMHELYSHSEYTLRYFSDPSEVTIDGTTIAVLPWICKDNYEDSMKFISDTKAQILFGHLEIQGFEMYKGSVNDHGFSPKIFDKFDTVCSGHFHHKSTRGNINYLGAPYEMCWSDFDDPRGFHIFDTRTRELTFIENPYKMFNKFYYDDTGFTMEDVLGIDFDQYKGKYVKIIVKSKSNPFWFDSFIEKLEAAGAIDVLVMEDSLVMGENESEEISDVEDTVSILRKTVDQFETKVDKKRLDSFLVSLYNEAISV
jgi:DNA repair exonuclease SbcCD nuclease subunit